MAWHYDSGHCQLNELLCSKSKNKTKSVKWFEYATLLWRTCCTDLLWSWPYVLFSAWFIPQHLFSHNFPYPLLPLPTNPALGHMLGLMGNQTRACFELHITTSSCIAHICTALSQCWECGHRTLHRCGGVSCACLNDARKACWHKCTALQKNAKCGLRRATTKYGKV